MVKVLVDFLPELPHGPVFIEAWKSEEKVVSEEVGKCLPASLQTLEKKTFERIEGLER